MPHIVFVVVLSAIAWDGAAGFSTRSSSTGAKNPLHCHVPKNCFCCAAAVLLYGAAALKVELPGEYSYNILAALSQQ